MQQLTKSAAVADACTTTCMVVGPEEAKDLVEREGVDAINYFGSEGYEIWVSPFESILRCLIRSVYFVFFTCVTGFAPQYIHLLRLGT